MTMAEKRKHVARAPGPVAECAAEDCAQPARARNGPRGGIPKYCSPACARRQRNRDWDRRERYGVHGATLGDYEPLVMEEDGQCRICHSADPNARLGLSPVP